MRSSPTDRSSSVLVERVTTDRSSSALGRFRISLCPVPVLAKYVRPNAALKKVIIELGCWTDYPSPLGRLRGQVVANNWLKFAVPIWTGLARPKFHGVVD